MVSLRQQLRGDRWGLATARAIATQIAPNHPAVRALIHELFLDDTEVRKRAADVARRITERDPKVLWDYAEKLAGLLDSVPVEESRTRWHLGLAVPRIAHTRAQYLRASRSMTLLAHDPSNVVRCSAVEGLGTLALAEPSLREDAEAMVESFLHRGTLAMKSRATHIRKLLAKAYGER
jgi:hypothetical protein